jgi:hypothetical protein
VHDYLRGEARLIFAPTAPKGRRFGAMRKKYPPLMFKH